MKYFGIERVIEPVGAIPPTAWRLDNSREVRPGEMRVAVEVIKLEGDNFNQICSDCQYNESRIKERILTIINKRGKLQNPYTESSGIIAGTVEEVSCGYRGGDFKEGDRIISLASISGFPIYIEKIDKVDYNYGEIWCSGYAIVFESSQIASWPQDLDIKPLLCALDEEGSLLDLGDVMTQRKPERIAIVGSNLIDMLLYARLAKNYGDSDVRIISVIDQDSLTYINKKEFEKTFGHLIDRVFFADMSRPVTAYEHIYREEEGLMDSIINLEDIKGAETISALLVKNKGFLFHAGVRKNYFQSLLAIDCLGKEVTSYALDGYAEKAYDFASDLIRQLSADLKGIDDILSHRSKKSMAIHSAKTKTREKEHHKTEDFVYMSPVTADLVDTVLNVAKYDCNVIIQGETGVGKEKVLDLLHRNSPRKGKPCIKINCATIQENLAESEFFGYEKGSFTGAQAAGKEGYFEMANNGTLFLDEIGSLPLAMQSKLLRVLQENSYYRVGGTEQKTVNVRVICANNIPLKRLVEEGSFREDLYYRLNICLIEVPPLRQRKEDIICLAENFIKNYSKKYGIEKHFTIDALDKLCDYHWPGNVRELENTVHCLYITDKGEFIDEYAVDDLLNDTFYDDVMVDIKKEFKSKASLDFSKIMEEQEKKLIAYALKKEKTTRKAAELLNIPQPTLARKKIKYGL